ncbi:hypothetical protein C1N53_15445 [Pontibacter sp. SGAir0037]|nr:hypothetical protein C1N53_15445 [Pontibacter sp. SGAir0037]
MPYVINLFTGASQQEHLHKRRSRSGHKILYYLIRLFFPTSCLSSKYKSLFYTLAIHYKPIETLVLNNKGKHYLLKKHL